MPAYVVEQVLHLNFFFDRVGVLVVNVLGESVIEAVDVGVRVRRDAESVRSLFELVALYAVAVRVA